MCRVEPTLGWYLQAIRRMDENYEARYGLVVQAMAKAHCLGYRTGYRIDPNEPDWPVAFIELPNGQVSWHMPQYAEEWDGHTTEEKMRRIHEYCDGIPGHEGQVP